MKLHAKPAILLPLGIVNLIIHIPALLMTILWSLLLAAMLDWPTEHMEFWTIVGLLPFFIPVVTCAAGIILPCLNRLREKPARLCFIFSLIGAALYVVMFAAIAWIGGHF